MSSVDYKEIYSRMFGKVQAYEFLDLTETQVNGFLCNYIHSVNSKPYIRKLFSSISLDDELEEITYTMKYVLDEESDMEFVAEVFAYGMVIEWLTPKINNITLINQQFSSSDVKWYSQSSHLKELRELRDSVIREQRSLISDRGYYWNTYLDGE